MDNETKKILDKDTALANLISCFGNFRTSIGRLRHALKDFADSYELNLSSKDRSNMGASELSKYTGNVLKVAGYNFEVPDDSQRTDS